MANDFVGAEHEFHSKEFALGWAERFVPTPERLRLFDLIFTELTEAVPDDGRIVELGMGPGYLASYLLERMPSVSYCGIDFSTPMLDIARERLEKFSPRVIYTQADLVDQAWEQRVTKPVHAIVSTWALHDLGSRDNINTVYQRSFSTLNSGGVLINGDFIKPIDAVQEFEGGRIYIAEHLESLDKLGYSNPRCLSVFETELDNPTSAQNYACIMAEK
ncbi:MAG: class I SAM-dependent methyltransferase [Gammaproteobacteria bacterium]|nr:class I SAM-dependent methyltransferase [Gammaproteobacteria bacterium]